MKNYNNVSSSKATLDKNTVFSKISKTLNPEDPTLKTLLTAQAKCLIEKIKEFNGEIIAVDFFALWCVQYAGKEAHLLSLEISDHDSYRENCNLSQIKSVLIQTNERYNYLFKGLALKTFIVQNAPKSIDSELHVSSRKKNQLIYCGSAVPWFGIFSCIEFIKDFPGYTLTVKGAIPPKIRKIIDDSFESLVTSNQLILNEQYLEPEELNEFLKEFYLGFVFYDFYRFEFINSFNYKTAPSGKLFQYYNAGLPVVGNNIVGLNSIEQYNAGVLINSLGSQSIKHAIEKIDNNYLSYVKGAKLASKDFDFHTSIEPFIEFIDEKLIGDV